MDDQNRPQNQPLGPDEISPDLDVRSADTVIDSMVEPDTATDALAPFESEPDTTTAMPASFESGSDNNLNSPVPAAGRPVGVNNSTMSSINSDEATASAGPAVSATTEPTTQAAPVVFGAPPQPSMTGAVFGNDPGAPGAKPRKKGLLAIIIASAAVVVLGGGSALAYNLYYQNEQKVVTDSIVNMMRAKTAEFTASLAVEGDKANGMDVNVELNGTGTAGTGQVDAKISAKMGSETYSITAAGVIDDKSDVYFKVGDVKKIVDEFKALLPADSQGVIDAIVAKIDNQWIKVDAKDMKDISADASKTQTCMTDALQKFQDDKVATKQIGDLYRQNKFIVVDEKLGSKDGSLGYVLSADKQAAKAFALSLKDTDLYKDLHKCDDSFTIDEKSLDTESTTSATDTRVELWVDRWSHQITKLSVVGKGADSKSTTTMIFEPVFNKAVTVQTPKDAMTIKQLQKDIEALSETYTSSLYGPSYGYDDYES